MREKSEIITDAEELAWECMDTSRPMLNRWVDCARSSSGGEDVAYGVGKLVACGRHDVAFISHDNAGGGLSVTLEAKFCDLRWHPRRMPFVLRIAVS